MTRKNKNEMFAILLIFLALSEGQTVSASTFDGMSSLTITLDSISNQTTPGGLSGLNISGSFELDEFSSSVFETGDGFSTLSYTGDALPFSPVASSSMSQQFEISGGASNGESHIFHAAYGTLDFENLSATDTYEISYHLDYDLNVGVSSDPAADITIGLDYGDFSAYSEVYASTFDLITDQLADSESFSITLTPGELITHYADVSISANAVSSVPLPASAWLFISGLAAAVRYRQSARF